MELAEPPSAPSVRRARGARCRYSLGLQRVEAIGFDSSAPRRPDGALADHRTVHEAFIRLTGEVDPLWPQPAIAHLLDAGHASDAWELLYSIRHNDWRGKTRNPGGSGKLESTWRDI